MRASKVALLVAAALVAGAWLLARPFVAAQVPHLILYEFPVAALLAALVAWLALRTPKERRAEPPAPWRKHRQVVRELPDPEAARLVDALERWARTGDGVADAAAVVATARGEPERADHYASVLAAPKRERQRRALLDELTQLPTNPGA